MSRRLVAPSQSAVTRASNASLTKARTNKNFKKASPVKPATRKSKRILNKSSSFRVLEDKVQSPKNVKEKLAIYDFTFDPKEEPLPPKKKKRAARKRAPAKSKVIIKNNYEQNISKTLQSLKEAVNKKFDNKVQFEENVKASREPQMPTKPPVNVVVPDKPAGNVESVVVDFDDINYSPVASPIDVARPQVKLSAINETRDQLYARTRSTMRPENKQEDPLNLLEELSFTDEVPIASSSMISTPKHPLASPWRVEYNNLPIRWQHNSYVKPNMTPAIESSFISPHEQKKHVYTNMVDDKEPLPEISTSDNTSQLKQTSIISFMREAAERSAKKKLNKLIKASSPVKNKKNISINNNLSDENVQTDAIDNNYNVYTSNETNKSSDSQTPMKPSDDIEKSQTPVKSPTKDQANAENYFGFDDSNNQENISPKKISHRRTLRPRTRGVLKDINGPTRAQIPIKAKLAANTEVVNKLFNELKSANNAPVLPEVESSEKDAGDGNTDERVQESMECDDQAESVHLFEDVDVIHHLKPHRKSYGNNKKVSFLTTNPDSQMSDDEVAHDTDDDDMYDQPFQMPTIKIKKTKPKKKKGIKFTKKEEDEMDVWAAAFNSMCEDVEAFPLVVE